MDKKYQPYISGAILGLILVLFFYLMSPILASIMVVAAILVFNHKKWI